MHRWFRLAAMAAALSALTIGGPAALASATPAGVVGHVYVNNNTAGQNTVAGFDRWANGSLSPVAGSPFNAGGAGVGLPTGSAGALQQSGDGHYLLAVDASSNQVSVLRIRPDGSLRLAEGSPVWSHGVTPISIAVHGSLVYVANTGAGGSNYTGFRLDAGGHLTAIIGSTYALPDSAQPGQVLFSPDGRHLVGTRVGTSEIDSFAVGGEGRLTAALGSPFTAQKIGPFGSQFRPTNPDQLFVSNAHDGTNNGSVSVYNVAADGTLTPIAGSPFPDGQTAPCWVAITHDGQDLFAINTAVPSVSGYTIAGNGTLTHVGDTTFSNPSGLKPFDAGIDPSDKFLYVVGSGAATISAFGIDGASLTELSSSPFQVPGNGAPFGIVVD